jgi:hypothetical protein
MSAPLFLPYSVAWFDQPRYRLRAVGTQFFCCSGPEPEQLARSQEPGSPVVVVAGCRDGW